MIGSVSRLSKTRPLGKQTISGTAFTTSALPVQQIQQTPTMPSFSALPRELRILIAAEIHDYKTYTHFRAIDRTNRALLPFYGIANVFKPTENEYLFVRWYCQQRNEDHPEGHLHTYFCALIDENFAALSFPLRYDLRSEDGFGEFHQFFLRIRDMARTPAGPHRWSRLAILERYALPLFQLDLLEEFRWNPHGVGLTEAQRLKIRTMMLSLRHRFFCAGRFMTLDHGFNFQMAVAETLEEYIDIMFRRLFNTDVSDPAVAAAEVEDWLEEIQGYWVFVMRVACWEDLANGIYGMCFARLVGCEVCLLMVSSLGIAEHIRNLR